MANSDSFVRDVVAEVVCMCNVVALARAVGGRILLPHRYRGMSVEEFLRRMAGRPILLIDDGEVSYLLVLRLEKMGVGDLARLLVEIATARGIAK